MNKVEYYKNNILETLSFFIISILPIIIFLGSGLLNLTIIIIDLLFLFEIYRTKKFKFLNNIFFYLLIFLWVTFIINIIFFSVDSSNSFLRTIGFLRFIFFVFAIKYIFEIKESYYSAKIFKIWTIIFLVVSFDLIIEYMFGQNILSFKAELPGRLVGFFKDEMKIGHFYSAFILIALISINNYLDNCKNIIDKKFFKDFIFFCLAAIFLITSFLIGERANFVRVLLMFIIFLLFFKKNFKATISILLICGIIFTSLVLSNDRFKQRFWVTFLNPLIKYPVETLFISPYGDHYKAALEVFNRNKFFGVGIRNYAPESSKNIYAKNASVHPHQVHFEFLAELGLFGYFCFFYFIFQSLFFSIRSFFIKNDFYKLSGILFIFVSLLPFIPSGSFFTTYGATLFWLNFAILVKNNKSI